MQSAETLRITPVCALDLDPLLKSVENNAMQTKCRLKRSVD
ncbi:MAG: hypothetical protein ACI90E_000701, partial [Yoonia sp.]